MAYAEAAPDAERQAEDPDAAYGVAVGGPGAACGGGQAGVLASGVAASSSCLGGRWDPDRWDLRHRTLFIADGQVLYLPSYEY